MKGRCFNLITVLLGLALISGCNLQVAGPVTGDAVGTAIAGTMAAQTELANIVVGTLRAMMTNTPTVTPTSQFSLTPSLTPLPTLTATPPFPMVSVTMDTNCRSGPGKVYDMIGALPVGKSAEVVGRDAYNQYWIIQNPNNPGTCWLWGQYATVTGDTSKLPVIAAPPTPTPAFTATPASAFTVAYVSTTHCGAAYVFRFNIKNTGGLTWESIRMVITDNSTITTFTHILNSFRSYNGCGMESNKVQLVPGGSGLAANANPGQLGYNPAGHSITATITVCSQDGLGGTCLSKTINFTP